MRHLIFIGMIIFLLPYFGKSQVDSVKVKYYVYCEVVAVQKPFSTKLWVVVDYGDENMEQAIRNQETGKLQTFKTVIEGLNFMSKKGWRLVNAFPVGEGGQRVYHYVMERLE